MSRLLDAKPNQEESLDTSLRPLTLKEYVGQKDLKENLKVFIGAALHRNEPLDHTRPLLQIQSPFPHELQHDRTGECGSADGRPRRHEKK